jgi:hypothetical protein
MFVDITYDIGWLLSLLRKAGKLIVRMETYWLNPEGTRTQSILKVTIYDDYAE